MTTADTLFHNPIVLSWHSGKCFLRRSLHTIKRGSHSHILIHSQVQILLIHVSWGAMPLDFLMFVKVRLSLSNTQRAPENQHSQPLKDTKHQHLQRRLGFSADHFLFTRLTQGVPPCLPSQGIWHLTQLENSSIKLQDAPTSLLLESLKFQNLWINGSPDLWPGQEGERLDKSLEFELQQSSPRIVLGLGAWGFLCSPPLNHLDNSTYITYSLSVEGLLSSGNYNFFFCAHDLLRSLPSLDTGKADRCCNDFTDFSHSFLS